MGQNLHVTKALMEESIAEGQVLGHRVLQRYASEVLRDCLVTYHRVDRLD